MWVYVAARLSGAAPGTRRRVSDSPPTRRESVQDDVKQVAAMLAEGHDAAYSWTSHPTRYSGVLNHPLREERSIGWSLLLRFARRSTGYCFGERLSENRGRRQV
jgi:hypothetical protein